LEKFKALKARDEQTHRTELRTVDDVGRVRNHLAQVYTNASKIYLLQEDAQAAEEHLLKAAEVDPNYVDRIEVRWIGGGVDIVEDIDVDRLILITEGAETVEVVAAR
jgi:hypothetical protein